MKDKLTCVKIFGTEYSLKGDENQKYMEELSIYVDKKMREIAERSALVSTAKVAVLTALRIADELYQLRKEKGGAKPDGSTEKRIKKLIEMIDHKVKDWYFNSAHYSFDFAQDVDGEPVEPYPERRAAGQECPAYP